MATGISSYLADQLLDAVGNADSFSVAAVWIKLHVASPGAAGTTSPATETTRKSASFAVSSAGLLTTDTALTWTSVAGSEDYTHFTAWDASTAGNFLFSGTITANAVTAGDTFVIAIGDIDVTLTIAS